LFYPIKSFAPRLWQRYFEWLAVSPYRFDVMNRLFEHGYIYDPRNKNKSVVLTREGLARSKELFEELFGENGWRGADKISP